MSTENNLDTGNELDSTGGLDTDVDNDLGTGGEGAADEYLFGDITADEASEQFGYLRELPSHLRGLESRVTDTVSPVLEQLAGLQERIGTQPVFEPKLERFAAALEDYDPKLAKTLLPALIEDLQGSMSVTPLGPEMLEPHITPMLQQAQQSILDQVVPSLLNALPFDANALVNRDPQNPDVVLAPQTELQKEFAQWWDQSDAPTRKALGTLGIPYTQALQRFGKWKAEQTRKKGEAAGNASARLTKAAQTSTGNRQNDVTQKLETEADGFNSIFSKRS